MAVSDIRLRFLGVRDYVETWRAMQTLTDTRDADAVDELWVLEHPPVYTQGLNGQPEHILKPGDIPVVHSDRGGQATYHGPGQLIVYTLIDLRRKNLAIRALVSALENAAVNTLAQYGLKALTRPDAPGVYVNDRKIASLGIRVRRGCSYHGLSLNVAMDLAPFGGINICGYPTLEATQLNDLGGPDNLMEVAVPLVRQLADLLELNPIA